ncbi:MAG: hypothetical protein NUV69_05485 [Candidatus Curtissbacteria bacterium]|nr:hypothetical protein [Candidatus Curtissbacteria bacterium]
MATETSPTIDQEDERWRELIESGRDVSNYDLWNLGEHVMRSSRGSNWKNGILSLRQRDENAYADVEMRYWADDEKHKEVIHVAYDSKGVFPKDDFLVTKDSRTNDVYLSRRRREPYSPLVGYYLFKEEDQYERLTLTSEGRIHFARKLWETHETPRLPPGK